MKKINKLFLLSIAIIVIIDIISYFTAGTTERNLKINIPLFIIFVFGIFLLFFSLKDLIFKNIKGSIIGFLVGLIIGVLSFGAGVYFLIFLLPIFGLIQNLIGCAGEDCWGILIILSSILLSLVGIVVGAYVQNKRIKKR